MPYSLIDIVYHPIKTHTKTIPAVVLICRDIKTRKKYFYRKSITPELYLEEWSRKGIQLDLSGLGVIREEYSPYRSFKGRTVRKLILKNPHKVPDIERYLRKSYGVKPLEADLSKVSGLPIKFLIDSNLYSGFTVEDHTLKPVDTPLLLLSLIHI